MKFSERLKKAPKALSVWAIGVLATQPAWWPLVEAAQLGFMGEDAQKWVTLALGVAGVLGWAVPQPSISDSER